MAKTPKMPTASIEQEISLLAGANVEHYLRQIGRGNPLTITTQLTADDVAEWDEWWLEIHAQRAPTDDALVEVQGTVDADNVLTFELSGTDTSLDLDEEEHKTFWIAVYSILSGGSPLQSWFVGWLRITEPNISAADDSNPATSMVRSLNLVTGFTGGGVTNLDGVTTTNLTVPRCFIFEHATLGPIMAWLKTSSAAAVAGEIVTPLDYHATTNNKKWFIG